MCLSMYLWFADLLKCNPLKHSVASVEKAGVGCWCIDKWHYSACNLAQRICLLKYVDLIYKIHVSVLKTMLSMLCTFLRNMNTIFS